MKKENQKAETVDTQTITEQPYNHKAKDVQEAIGVNVDDINKRMNDMFESLPEKLSASVVAEQFETRFSKRELAFMLERKTYELSQIHDNPIFQGLFGGKGE